MRREAYKESIVRHCYMLAKRMESVKTLTQEKEKLSLKVRFYEKKMTL